MKNNEKIIDALNTILEFELAGVVRYTPVSYTHLRAHET